MMGENEEVRRAFTGKYFEEHLRETLESMKRKVADIKSQEIPIDAKADMIEALAKEDKESIRQILGGYFNRDRFIEEEVNKYADKGTSCQKVDSKKYNEFPQKAVELRNLLIQIAENKTMTKKRKEAMLKNFRKTYPNIYSEYFPNEKSKVYKFSPAGPNDVCSKARPISGSECELQEVDKAASSNAEEPKHKAEPIQTDEEQHETETQDRDSESEENHIEDPVENEECDDFVLEANTSCSNIQ